MAVQGLFKLIVIGDTGTGQIHLLSPPPAVLLTALDEIFNNWTAGVKVLPSGLA